MDGRNRHRVLAAAIFAVVAVAAIATAAIFTLGRWWTIGLLALLSLAGAGPFAAWWLAERRARASEVAEERTTEWLESAIRAREDELAQLRVEHDRAGREHERLVDWNRRLRAKLAELRSAHGPLGDTADTKELVLRLALDLLDAKKGLLLARTDDDGDGDLDLVCAVGFEHDPEHSLLVQRFGNEVIARDRTVREDDLGAVGFQQKTTEADKEIRNLVAIPMYMADKFHGVVVAANKPGGFHDWDDEVLLALGDHAGAVLQNARLHGELRGSYLTTVSMLAEAIEVKDPFLRGHSNEVSDHVSAVAERLGIEGRAREELVFGSLLHDVGKLGISERILLKPGRLSDEERSIVELHPRIGYRLVQQVPLLRRIAPAILHHHERFDGAGYPAKLKGEEIPLEARIICVADAYSAMTAERPYGTPRSPDEACTELERCAGTQFDPEIVRLFCAEVKKTPRSGLTPQPLAIAMDDPELDIRRGADEPLFGYGSFEVIDNLTLLYSHRYFHENAASAAERARVQERPFAIVLVRLADMERINREDGFSAGDEALQKVARAVQRGAGDCGGTACRVSGRTLGVVIPGADETSTDQCVEEISSQLGDSPSVRMSHAVGQPGEDAEKVIERARLELGSEVTA